MHMQDVAVVSKCPNSIPFFTTNQTPAVSAYPTLVNIAGDVSKLPGVVSLNNSQTSPFSFMDLTFWGQGTAANTCNVQIVGYRLWQHPTSTNDEYEPFVLADVLCTLGSQTSAVNTSDKMVSTITVNNGTIVGSSEITPTASNCAIQHMQLDPKGCQFVRLVPGTGNVTNINGKIGGF